MIDFDLTNDQRLLEQSVREWAGREIAPHIHDADRAHRFDRERVLGGMAALGSVYGTAAGAVKLAPRWFACRRTFKRGPM